MGPNTGASPPWTSAFPSEQWADGTGWVIPEEITSILDPCLLQQGPPGCRVGPGRGGVSSRTESTPPCSRIVRGSSILSRCRLRPSAKTGEAAPSPLPRSPCSPCPPPTKALIPGPPIREREGGSVGMGRCWGSSQGSTVTPPPSPAWSCPHRPRRRTAGARLLWGHYQRGHGRTPPSSTEPRRQ